MATPDVTIQCIREATGPLGDFRMSILIQILRQSGLAFAVYEDSVRIILSRYKEHVAFWGVNSNTVTRELQELANTLSRNELELFNLYNIVSSSEWRQYLPQTHWHRDPSLPT